MQTRLFQKLLLVIFVVMSGSVAAPASAANNISCKLTYKLSGWSFVYKQYDGAGVINCNNGQQAQVKLASKSVGFTIGRSEVEGIGKFSDVKTISETFGTFVALEGHGGVIESGHGQVLTRGIVSLALSGKGRGIDVGATLGALTISPVNSGRSR